MVKHELEQTGRFRGLGSPSIKRHRIQMALLVVAVKLLDAAEIVRLLERTSERIKAHKALTYVENGRVQPSTAFFRLLVQERDVRLSSYCTARVGECALKSKKDKSRSDPAGNEWRRKEVSDWKSCFHCWTRGRLKCSFFQFWTLSAGKCGSLPVFRFVCIAVV